MFTLIAQLLKLHTSESKILHTPGQMKCFLDFVSENNYTPSPEKIQTQNDGQGLVQFFLFAVNCTKCGLNM